MAELVFCKKLKRLFLSVFSLLLVGILCVIDIPFFNVLMTSYADESSQSNILAELSGNDTNDIPAKDIALSDVEDYFENKPCLSRSYLDADSGRAYFDWMDQAYTAGIERKMKIMVYAKQGETLYFGSDIFDSMIDINESLKNTVSGADIVLIAPDGTRTAFDVIQNGEGHIKNVTMEKNGANVDGSNTNGYTPLKYAVNESGVYTFYFHSKTGVHSEPTVCNLDSTWNSNNCNVGAWDISVEGSDGSRKHGRVYTKYYCINTGGLNKFNSSLYIMTNDGYVYKTRLKNIQPAGFVFFGNNRGLTVLDGYSHIAYKSVKCVAATGITQLSNLSDYGITFQNPAFPDTELNSTFKIFFEEPDAELWNDTGILDESGNIFYPKAYVPKIAKNFSFVGSGINQSYMGNGGYFIFESEKATSAEVKISFINKTDAEGNPLQPVLLANTVSDGINRFYWDGYDGAGHLVPPGSYTPGQDIEISVTLRSGEYHFPLLDVEYNTEGISVERINRIYDISGNDITDEYADSAYDVYYDNSPIYAGGQAVFATNKDGSYKYLPSKRDVNIKSGSDGIDYSEHPFNTQITGAMKFGNNAGDGAVLDLWTYSLGNASQLFENDINIIQGNAANISGRVFFDKNRDGKYVVMDGDDLIKGVQVYLYEEDGTTPVYLTALDELGNKKCDENGKTVYLDKDGNETVDESQRIPMVSTTNLYGVYSFYGLPYYEGISDKYTVSVKKPKDNFELTTNQVSYGSFANQLITVSAATVLPYSQTVWADDVGYSNLGGIKLTLLKETAEGKKTKTPIQGAKFRIYKGKSYDSAEYMGEIGELTTNESGQIVIPILNEGNYIFKEVSTAFGFIMEGSNLTTERNGNGVITNCYTDTVEVVDGSISEITVYNKVDASVTPSLIIKKNVDSVVDLRYMRSRENDSKENNKVNVEVDITLKYSDNESMENAVSSTKRIAVKSVSNSLNWDDFFPNVTLKKGTWIEVSENVVDKITLNSGYYYPAGTLLPYYKLDLEKSYGWNADDAEKIHFFQDGTIKMQIAESNGKYEVNLENKRQLTDIIAIQKVWLDQDGHSLNNPTFSDGTGIDSVNVEVQRTVDGINWESVVNKKKTDGSQDTDLISLDLMVIDKKSNSSIWTKSFIPEYWGFEFADANGKPYVYRIVETDAKILDSYIVSNSNNYNPSDRPDALSNPTLIITNQKKKPYENPKFEFSFVKVDSNSIVTDEMGLTSYNVLTGAEFTLYRLNCDESHKHSAPGVSECWVKEGTYKTNGLGEVSLGEHDCGEYALMETKTPKGYNKPDVHWEINGKTDGTVYISEEFLYRTTIDGKSLYLLPNTPKTRLPSVGGCGIAGVGAIGLSLCLVSLLFKIKSKICE